MSSINAHILERVINNTSSRSRFFYHGSGYTEVKEDVFYRAVLSLADRLSTYQRTEVKLNIVFASTPMATLAGFYASIMNGIPPVIVPANMGSDANELVMEKFEVLRTASRGCFHVLCCDQSLKAVPTSFQADVLYDSLPTDSTYLSKNPLQRQEWELPDADDVAFYQLSSASTGTSKIIAISHRNVIENTHAIFQASGGVPEDKVVSWLPLNHDMGLVGTELFSLINRLELYLMSPAQFLRKPMRWLQTISDFSASLSPAPNFAYDYCCQFVSDAQASSLDLSSWKIAYNGSEPVQATSLHSFVEKFGASGFRAETFLPCYGMAETTLAATFTKWNEPPSYVSIKNTGVRIGDRLEISSSSDICSAVESPEDCINVISCGKAVSGLKVRLLDDEGLEILSDAVPGEVHVEGSSVALGYLMSNGSIDPFESLTATGDIGFYYEGELYVVERIKNILVVNGKNYTSHHVESAIASKLRLPAERVAVFQTSLQAEQRVVVLVEATKGQSLAEIEEVILQYQESQMPLNELCVSYNRIIPKTTSGKKQHYKCRELYTSKPELFDYQITLNYQIHGAKR